MEINGSTVLVTGAASGMGAYTAKALARKGAQVALLDLKPVAIRQLAKSLGGLAIECDVTDEHAVSNALEQVELQWGAPRIVVNCAGIVNAERVVGRQGPMALGVFSKVIQVNLIGTFNVMRLSLEKIMHTEPVNADGERGVIINTASVAAFDGQIGQAAYSASKGGIVSMTLPIAREMAPWGIRIMTIAPGIMETPMLGELSEATRKSLLATMVFPKRLGKPEEFSGLVEHIVTNPMLNGEVIRLDGGIRLAPK